MVIVDFVKSHPVAVGIASLVVVVGVVIMSSGGGGSETVIAGSAGQSDQEIMAGLNLQAMQMQAGQSAAQLNAEKEAKMAEINANLTLGKLQLQQQSNSDKMAASIANKQIAASHSESMAANAANKAISILQLKTSFESDKLHTVAALKSEKLQSKTAIQQSQIQAAIFAKQMNTQLKQAKDDNVTLRYQIGQNAKTMASQIKAMVKMTKIQNKKGLLGSIFS